MELMAETLPEDSSCEDIEVDPQLTFLDDYIKAALRASYEREEEEEEMAE